MLELKALLLTQGMHGMVSQVEGLAKALKFSFKHQKIKLKPLWNLIPPKLTPISENLLTEKFVCDSKIIISCGRKSVIPSIALKKRFGKEIFNIHIQDPKVSISNFDLIVSPEHDNLKGENVITTKGAIHYITLPEIKKNLDYLKISEKNKKIVSFIVGGPNNYYKYSETEIEKLFNKVKIKFPPNKYKLIIIPSYRTPKNIINLAFNTFNSDHLVIKSVDKNAYLCALGISDLLVVTCDSISMISEAATTGKPIFMVNLNPKKNIKRFRKFYNQFKEMNIIRDLEDKNELWTYNKLDEVNRIATVIKKKMITNGII